MLVARPTLRKRPPSVRQPPDAGFRAGVGADRLAHRPLHAETVLPHQTGYRQTGYPSSLAAVDRDADRCLVKIGLAIRGLKLTKRRSGCGQRSADVVQDRLWAPGEVVPGESQHPPVTPYQHTRTSAGPTAPRDGDVDAFRQSPRPQVMPPGR